MSFTSEIVPMANDLSETGQDFLWKSKSQNEKYITKDSLHIGTEREIESNLWAHVVNDK